MLFLITTITAVRGFIEPIALLLFEVLACLVTQTAGGTLTLTDNDPVADISAFTPEPSGTEVVRVVKDPTRIDIIHTMKLYLL